MTPGVAKFVAGCCTAFGVVAALIGLAMLVFGFMDIGNPASGGLNLFLTGLGVMAGAFLWFALGAVVALLAQIAHNTKRQAGRPSAESG